MRGGSRTEPKPCNKLFSFLLFTASLPSCTEVTLDHDQIRAIRHGHIANPRALSRTSLRCFAVSCLASQYPGQGITKAGLAIQLENFDILCKAFATILPAPEDKEPIESYLSVSDTLSQRFSNSSKALDWQKRTLLTWHAITTAFKVKFTATLEAAREKRRHKNINYHLNRHQEVQCAQCFYHESFFSDISTSTAVKTKIPATPWRTVVMNYDGKPTLCYKTLEMKSDMHFSLN